MSAATTATGPLLEARLDGSTLVLTLSRPDKMNALSAGLVEALLAQVDAAQAKGVRLLVLKGAGKNFSAGFDMGGIDPQSEGDLVLRFIRIEQLLQALRHAPFDTMVLAHGRNFGAGVDLIAACARRIATPDASFRMPGLRFGLVLGTRLFAERVGPERARAVHQVSKTFNASEALEWGFLTEIASQEHWDPVIVKAQAGATALPADASARLFRVTTADHRDADLAELVRSAAQPGLKDRISAYLASSAVAAAPAVAPAQAGAPSPKD
jgi:enoyl-CoA hydratase/carnithine racemase